MGDDTVRVALRIRPLVPTEVERGCQMCINVVPGEQQVQVNNSDKSFSFNHVFGPETDHDEFYNTAVRNTVCQIFKGYNVTILAYGQTGSGKTHSMGTNYKGEGAMGVIPRAVNEIFDTMKSRSDHSYKVAVSFMELYQEQLYDLLADKQRSERIVDIREDVKGIKIVGLTEKEVTNAQEALEALSQGSSERATGATAMNLQSSRSHAIFTIVVHQTKLDNPNSATTSKFHLVDLAGSERSKKTQATGERFKEGVNINKGLLALGNVISQLGEGGSAASYIGYRDSKLTRLLQDSLGGNSMTLMIACISPADYNLDETLSTLRYADRARKIRNKPIVNQDPKAAEINRLNGLVQELRLALAGQGNLGPCPPEHAELQENIRVLQRTLRELTNQLNTNLIETVNMHERAELAEQASESMILAMSRILEDFEEVLAKLDENLPEHAILKPTYKKLLDLRDHQTKTTEEIHQHTLTAMCSIDESRTGECNSSNASCDENQSTDTTFAIEDEMDHETSGTDLDEKHAEHTLRQVERNHEVQSINRTLAIKEELVSTLLKNASQIAEQSKELEHIENELKTLQAEKEELVQALRNAQSNNVSAKLAAARRKKVQELEKKIGELTRKCTEQSKIIKKKEKSDDQIKNLSKEIQSLKQARVKLVREMRKDAETFGKWKRASEREIYKLKDQNRKKQTEMSKLQWQHNKQQTVLKRKMEEVFAINKRLKEKYGTAVMNNRQQELRHQAEQRIKELEEEVESYRERCERLEEQLSVQVNSSQNKEKKKAAKGSRTRQMLDLYEYDSSYHITDESFCEVDDNNDPDWKKTPLYKRIQKVRSTRSRANDISAAKRTSDGDVKCSCKTQCSTRLCSCRKIGINCSNCNCNPELCQNKDNENVRQTLFTDFTGENDEEADPSKRPRLTT